MSFSDKFLDYYIMLAFWGDGRQRLASVVHGHSNPPFWSAQFVPFKPRAHITARQFAFETRPFVRPKNWLWNDQKFKKILDNGF